MTIGNLIEKKDYDYIGLRVTLPERHGGGDEFFGYAKSENGKLISLDGDTYSEDTEIISYEEWEDDEKGIKNGLTIVFEGEWTELK